ncbi:MAG: phosphoribosylformylglycinamidine cyclo-ligase [Firmicutes bacterium]|jgi:phosphoribosylformylglycinamidine cyclo-ligase|nr:phosphoribosylformylglycinamidine cyclo-ligase [Bacillota bacterium]
MESFDYKKAGVDLEAGEKVVDEIKKMVRSTFRPEVLTDLGGFAGLFQPKFSSYRQPVFAAATDGVGTKLKIAFMSGKHDTVGIDAVAMCVNDLVVQGAEPLLFLDYLAVGKIDVSQVKEIVGGVVEGCRQANCTLLGGETAEMPGFYAPGEYDLAGFALGIVDREKIITGESIVPGDRLVGLASSGLHSNGFSLVRKIFFEHAGLAPDFFMPQLGRTLGEELLKPTVIYVPLVLSLLKDFTVKGIAHITGGGLKLNLPRILPAGVKAVIEKDRWTVPPVFPLVQEYGNVPEGEMYRTFNMGIGMVLVVSSQSSGDVLAWIAENGGKAWEIGVIQENDAQEAGVEIRN